MTKPTIWEQDMLKEFIRITGEHKLLADFAMWLVPLATKDQSPDNDDDDYFNSAATDLWVKFNESIGGTEQEQKARIESGLFVLAQKKILKESNQ